MTGPRRSAPTPGGRASPRPAAPGDPGLPHAGPQGRNTYVDLVRFVAIAVVILGHWLATIIVVEDGRPRGLTALAEVGYMRWLTLLLQVMPMFFFAGGYAAAASWPSWRSRGGRWAGWAHARFVRLLRPTTWFIVIMTTVSAIAMALGAPTAVLAQAGWGVALQLWFLPVYLLLLLLAVPMIVAWQRVGWLVLAAAIAIVAVADVLVRGLGITAAGWVSYLVAPAAGLLLGVAWHAGALARRSLPIMLIIGGVVALLVLVAGLGYPPWMVGVPGEPPANTAPPNLALVAYSAGQVGLVLLLERPGRRLLERPRVLATVARGNAVIMTMYLWHMVPVLIVAALLAATGLPTGPTPGGAPWWALRLVWFAILGTILAGLVRLTSRFERPSPPLLGLSGRLPSVLILACAALAGYGLARLAVGGFAPAGRLPLGALAAYAGGLVALWAAGTRTRPASSG